MVWNSIPNTCLGRCRAAGAWCLFESLPTAARPRLRERRRNPGTPVRGGLTSQRASGAVRGMCGVRASCRYLFRANKISNPLWTARFAWLRPGLTTRPCSERVSGAVSRIFAFALGNWADRLFSLRQSFQFLPASHKNSLYIRFQLRYGLT
jgi:hypothetical protein